MLKVFGDSVRGGVDKNVRCLGHGICGSGELIRLIDALDVKCETKRNQGYLLCFVFNNRGR